MLKRPKANVAIAIASLALFSTAAAKQPASSAPWTGVHQSDDLVIKEVTKTTTHTAKSAKSKMTTSTVKGRGTASIKPASWRILTVASKGLSEVSGCAFSRRDPDRVWLHNDSGDGPKVVSVHIGSGAVGKVVELTGVDVVDPEDIAMTSAGDLILADIGDNAEARTTVQLFRFREPPADAALAVASRLILTYPDGAHNAEALVVVHDGSAAIIFTKDSSGVAQVFWADLTASGPQILTSIGTVKISGEVGNKANMISAADLAGNSIVLRTYQFGYVLTVPNGGSFADVVRSAARRFEVPSMIQGEALCVSPNGLISVTASESQGAATFGLAVGPSPL
jgi:hypothetical protein